jgi:L-malate glycosyltransferase
MKILQLVTKRQYRGAEVFAANLSAELIELGHEIIFAGLYYNSSNILTVKQAYNVDLSNNKTSGFSLKLLLSLVRLIQKENPSIIQCNGSDTLKYMVVASLYFKKIPIVYRNISVISEWVNGPAKVRLYKNVFKRIHHVSSVGTESINDLIKTFDYPREKTSVIRRGIPLRVVNKEDVYKIRKELNFSDSDEIVVHIGNFSPEKNHSFLLDVFSKIKTSHPNIKLVCVGNGITYSNIQEKIIENNLEKTVFLLGFRKDIPEILAASKVFVLSSIVEGVPGVILEAASQRTPSVSTNVGGVQEVLYDGETGFVINDFDKEAFRSKVIELVENQKLNETLGEKAYSLVTKEFNPEQNAIKFQNLYNKLIAGDKFVTNENVNIEKPRKILQLIQKKQFRGAEVFCAQLSEHISTFGHEVEIIGIYDGFAELPYKKEIKSLNRNKGFRFLDISGWKNLAKIISEFNPDIIQANAADTLKYVVFSKLAFGWKSPVVYRNASSPSYYIRSWLSKSMNSFLLKNVDLIISVSEASKNDLNKMFPSTIGKSIVIPVGLENVSVNSENLRGFNSEGFFNLIHVGSFTREKNHKGLLEIFKIIYKQNPQVKLHLVGDGPLKTHMMQLVSEIKLEENIIFHNEIKCPLPFIKAADVLVLPSVVEGLPGVILEAMYCLTPVVAYDVGGISEIVSDKTGILIKMGNESDFANAVLKILNQGEEYRKVTAKNMVLKDYMNHDIAQKFLQAYNQLIINSTPKSN